MKLTIEPTGWIMKIDGHHCRVWKGHDEAGTEVHLFITTLSPQTHDPERLKPFDALLIPKDAPDLERVPGATPSGLMGDPSG